MKKTFSIIIIVLCAAIYYCSNNPDIIEKYTDFREKKPFIGSDKSGLGGLYGLCYLPEYRMPFNYTLQPAKKSASKNIDLYLFCDSYLFFRAKQEHFYAVDTLIKIKWWELNTYIAIPRLNPHKHNILVVEMTERYVRDICTKYSGMIGTLKIDSTYRGNTPYYLETSNESIKTSFLEKHFFNPNINSNLELNLFGYPLFRPIKELKAEFNYAVFNRANNDVFVDKKNRFLYYGPTVSGNQIMNSFFPLDSSEMPLICNTLNSVYRYYKTKGFEEIYLAIIPNPVTMINPQLGNYNGLIPKLYAVDSLKMRIIDVYATYAKNPLQYYSRNDTHWSSAGFQTWLDEFNKTLGEISAWPLR